MPCALSPGTEQPPNKRPADSVPFLNGILLATEENHTATVRPRASVLIRHCTSCAPAHAPTAPLRLSSASQSSILRGDPTPPLPIHIHYIHTTRGYTHTYNTRTQRAIPPPSVPNHGRRAIPPLPSYQFPPQHLVGRSAQPVQLCYAVQDLREAPDRGACSATLLCMKTRTTPNPSFAADHTQARLLALQPFPASFCFSTPAHHAPD